MKRISSTTCLKNEIVQLENRKILQEQLLKEQFQATYKTFNPMNIILNSFRDAASSKEVQEDIIESTANYIADLLSKKITQGSSEGDLKDYLGKLLHYGITTFAASNSDTIRTIGECFVESFLTTRKKQEE